MIRRFYERECKLVGWNSYRERGRGFSWFNRVAFSTAKGMCDEGMAQKKNLQLDA